MCRKRYCIHSPILLSLLLFFVGSVRLCAQSPDYSKMSSFVRQLVLTERGAQRRQLTKSKETAERRQELCAFVKVADAGEQFFSEQGCRLLASFGDIHIVSIPLNRLSALSSDSRVLRIEAHQSAHAQLDSASIHINTLPIYEGRELPEAYTGSGVVVGIQDVGFDLTHPTYYDVASGRYRIARLWDQLSTDTIGSDFYVGNEYVGEELLTEYAHSRDAEIIGHGTHTSGIAAGSGAGTPYRGIAYDSELCLVNNAVNETIELIDSLDLYKYTYATDALGFKYIFDYAECVGKPCVVSFSEGSNQDFVGDDQLYYSILDSLTGPGRIILASAGNSGWLNTYFHKPKGQAAMGSFIQKYEKDVYFTVKTDAPLSLRFTSYFRQWDRPPAVFSISSEEVLAAEDSEIHTTIRLHEQDYDFDIVAYPSCYDATQTCLDFHIHTDPTFGVLDPVSVELVGEEADAEFFKIVGELVSYGFAPELNAGEPIYNIHSPSSAPSVISVGATSYRTSYTNAQGKTVFLDWGKDGERSGYSSVGPTFDHRIKPDVMAPGTNIISSFCSYYLDANPDSKEEVSTVAYTSQQDRDYPWTALTGTSMSSPMAAGAIALWLQAKPTLSPEEALEVISHTSTHPDPSLNYPNNLYGYGQIDAYRGLLYLLGIEGIEEITPRQPSAVNITVTPQREAVISFDDIPQKAFTVRLYSLTGTLLHSSRQEAGREVYTLPLPQQGAGVYVLQLSTDEPLTTGSVLVRLP